ncbi:MAG: hypothetical protein HY751_05740 [Nitrospinae bacterium]|nr:hypothetical protein [Nitrospinota bacterium]
MNNLKRKITLDRFMSYPSQVVSLANRRGLEVVVYDSTGPIARIMPCRKNSMVAITNLRKEPAEAVEAAVSQEIGYLSEVTSEQLDTGGVWRLDDYLKKDMERPAWVSRLSRLSVSGLLKKVKVLDFIPSSVRA